MSKDYKIGIVVGLIVLVVGVVYYTITAKQEPPVEQQPVQEETDNQPLLGAPAPSVERPAGPVEVPAPVLPVVPVEVAVPEKAPQPDASTEGMKEFETKWGMPSSTGGETAAPKPVEEEVATITFADENPAGDSGKVDGAQPEEVAVETTESYWKMDDNAEETMNTPVPENVRPVEAQPEPVAFRGKGTYVVQKEDSLWKIAEKKYGAGKYAKLIQDANPDINPDALPVGKKLIIPPLPSQASTPTTPRDTTPTPKTSPRGTIKNAAGQDVYIVTKADTAGFWGIAKKVYDGNAGKYTLIQNANRNVSSDKLRPGMKLIIPPLPKATPATNSSGIYRSTTPASTAGGDVYTVRKGDTIWGIAERKYGNGKYKNIIIQANPKVDPDNLKTGQKLVLPKKPAASTSTRRTTTPSSTGGAVRPGEPDFGP